MPDRRDVLLGAAAASLLQSSARAGSSPDAASRLDTLFSQFMREQLEASPETATSLGLDTGDLSGARSRLDDTSLAGEARSKSRTASQLQRLKTFPRSDLSGLSRVNYDAVLYGREISAEADASFNFGEAGARSPYVISQLTGAYQSVPTFLDTQHPIDTAADAEAYLARLAAFGAVLDGETERLRHDAGLGVIPPDFILDKTLEQMVALTAQKAETSNLVRSIARRTSAKGVSGDWAERASRLYQDSVHPALVRQQEAVQVLRGNATSLAGVGSRPQGEHYYRVALRAYTTSRLTPEEVHAIGLEQTKAYQAEIDVILRQQGLTKGSVGDRILALSTDPKHLWPDTDAGKNDLIAYLNDRVSAVTPRLPRDFRDPPSVPLEIRRVPPTIEAGAPLGYYQSASLDGSRPAIYYINLAHTADWPRWLVSSVTFHEGVPGHHLQISTAQHIKGLPLIRKTAIYSGYAEGWALYAEQSADELGLYENDPLGRVGYLKSELWRACRMVLDTGVHTRGWTRDQAIRWKMDNDGSLKSGAANEVERYCVWPGQAPSYKIGHTVINQLRNGYRMRKGGAYDIRDFHTAVLGSGGLPLEVLEQVVAQA